MESKIKNAIIEEECNINPSKEYGKLTKQSSSGKESVIRVLKANADKRMTVREVHDYMLAKGYKMCGVATIGKAFESLRNDAFISIETEEGTPHIKSTAAKGRRQMYAKWHADDMEAFTNSVVPARHKLPIHKSLAAAQDHDDVDIYELMNDAPKPVAIAYAWLKDNNYDILIVKK